MRGLTKRTGSILVLGVVVVAAVAAASASATMSGRSVATAGKWCSGVHLRAFMGGAPGDTAAAIVFNGAKAAQTDLGPKIDYVFSGWSSEKMLTQLRDALAAKVNGVAMIGLPGDAALMPLAK